MHYIVVTRHSDLWLVGPFETDIDAANYGAAAEHSRWAHDPRWQTIELTNTYGMRIDAPDRRLRVRQDEYKLASLPTSGLGGETMV